jgi:hypothetical protein
MNPTPSTQLVPSSCSPWTAPLLALLSQLLLPANGSQQSAGRGNPGKLSSEHLWLAFLQGILLQGEHVADIWNSLLWQQLGPFAPITLSYNAVRQRLLAEGTTGLEVLLQRINRALQARPALCSALPQQLAAFAKQVVALDECTLESLQRLCADLRQEPLGSPRLLMGKLAGLFDLRSQQWIRLQLREASWANCKVGVLLLLEGLPVGSLILADLGYFSFAWFDYLTAQGYYWVSRWREGTSYELVHVFYHNGDLLDALVWLGTHRADRAAYLVRLVQFRYQGQLYRYLANVCDPERLPLHEIAELYARRWDIELAFKLLKTELGLRLWWTATPVLLEAQLIGVLILAQVLHALQVEIAAQCGVPVFDVSLHRLLKLLQQANGLSGPLVPQIVEQGRSWGIIRPNSRRLIVAPHIPLRLLRPAPVQLPRWRPPRYAQRKSRSRKPRPAHFPRFLTRFLI